MADNNLSAMFNSLANSTSSTSQASQTSSVLNAISGNIISATNVLSQIANQPVQPNQGPTLFNGGSMATSAYNAGVTSVTISPTPMQAFQNAQANYDKVAADLINAQTQLTTAKNNLQAYDKNLSPLNNMAMFDPKRMSLVKTVEGWSKYCYGLTKQLDGAGYQLSMAKMAWAKSPSYKVDQAKMQLENATVTYNNAKAAFVNADSSYSSGMRAFDAMRNSNPFMNMFFPDMFAGQRNSFLSAQNSLSSATTALNVAKDNYNKVVGSSSTSISTATASDTKLQLEKAVAIAKAAYDGTVLTYNGASAKYNTASDSVTTKWNVFGGWTWSPWESNLSPSQIDSGLSTKDNVSISANVKGDTVDSQTITTIKDYYKSIYNKDIASSNLINAQNALKAFVGTTVTPTDTIQQFKIAMDTAKAAYDGAVLAQQGAYTAYTSVSDNVTTKWNVFGGWTWSPWQSAQTPQWIESNRSEVKSDTIDGATETAITAYHASVTATGAAFNNWGTAYDQYRSESIAKGYLNAVQTAAVDATVVYDYRSTFGGGSPITKAQYDALVASGKGSLVTKILNNNATRLAKSDLINTYVKAYNAP